MSEEDKNTTTFKDLVKATLENPKGSTEAKLKHCIFHYQGYRGRVLGATLESCPYKPNTREFFSWHLGWNLADNELKELKDG